MGGKVSSPGQLCIEKKGEVKNKIVYFCFAVQKMRFTEPGGGCFQNFGGFSRSGGL